MASETSINVTDRDATIGSQVGGNAITGTHDRRQRSVTLSVLSHVERAETVRLHVYGDRQTDELASALEGAAARLRATLDDGEPDDVEIDVLSALSESGGR